MAKKHKITKSLLELWLPILGYEGLYDVSSFGRVKSLKRMAKYPAGWSRQIHEKILHPINDTYPRVKLCKNGVVFTASIHVLVATAFLENPENKRVVHHKDDNKWNCNVLNLEWSTYAENNKKAFESGARTHKGENNAISKLKLSQVISIKKLLSKGDHTQKEIGKMYGVNPTTIAQIKSGATWNLSNNELIKR